MLSLIVYDLKFVGPFVEFKLVAPMPEQLKTTTTLQALQGNSLLWSQFVLGWVQRNSNFGFSDRRLQEWVRPSVICLTKCTFLGQAHQVNLCIGTCRVSKITFVLGKNDLCQADNSGFPGVNQSCRLSNFPLYHQCTQLKMFRQHF